jgi:hypothetical protein
LASGGGVKLLVCGGRNFTDRRFAFARLDAIHDSPHGPVTDIVEGGAAGGDALGRAWCLQRLGKPSIRVDAEWDRLDAPGAFIKTNRLGKRYNANAGHARNQRMLEEHRPDACLALPGGAGTGDMVCRARAAGVAIL